MHNVLCIPPILLPSIQLLQSPVIAVKNIKVQQMENPFMLFFYSALKDASLFKSTKKKKPFIYDFEGG